MMEKRDCKVFYSNMDLGDHFLRCSPYSDELGEVYNPNDEMIMEKVLGWDSKRLKEEEKRVKKGWGRVKGLTSKKTKKSLMIDYVV